MFGYRFLIEYEGSNVDSSQESLTSHKTLTILVNLPDTHPDLHNELNTTCRVVPDEDEEPFSEDEHEDDSDVPIDVLVDFVVSEGAAVTAGFAVNDEVGGVVRNTAAEDIELEVAEVAANSISSTSSLLPPPLPPQELGRGKRVKTVSSRLNFAPWDQN